MVPHFTGRQKECEEITGHVTSGSSRIVSIWSSPGFGKTSVAIAVRHRLHCQGLPVYYLSLRGLQSTADLSSKLLSLFRRPVASKQKNQQHPLIDDELSHLFSELSEPFTIILDNANELLSEGPNAKEDFTHFLASILGRNEKVTFVITTRESLEFLNVQFQGHQGVRISPLDELSSQNLVNELLPDVTFSDCKRISKICGHVPLAMKLLSSFLSEDDAELGQVLDDFMASLQNHNIVEMLDNPDDPSNLRLQLLFDSSFQRLSAQEKEALVSLCVLPESFDLSIAAAVLGKSQISAAKKVLHSLRRKSLLESSSKPDTFLMHQLILSFAKQKGENEMKEVLLKSKARLCAFYVSRFENLNEEFLTGHSMPAFIDFYEDEQSITRSLIEGSSDCQAAEDVFEVLVNADIFLYSLFRGRKVTFCKIYDSATKTAKMLESKTFYRQLLVSKSLCKVTSSTRSRSMQLLSQARHVEESHGYPASDSERGKRMCYNGIYQLANNKTEEGVQCLEDAVSLMNSSPQQRILKLVAFQILAIYHRFKKNSSGMSLYYIKALQECKALGDTQLLVIPEGTEKELPEIAKEDLNQRYPDASNNQPLIYEIISLINATTKQFFDDDTKQYLTDGALNIAEEIKKPTLQSSLGLFNFQTNVMTSLCNLKKFEVAAKLSASRINFQEMTIKKSKSSKDKYTRQEENLPSPTLDQKKLARSYSKHASIHYKMQNYLEAQKSEQRALETKIRLFGDENESTGESYHSLSITQRKLGDVSSALQSAQRALDIRLKLFGEEHSSTADSYHSLGVTQHKLGDFSSALKSKQRALEISRKLFGEEHSRTADNYLSLGITQRKQRDFFSALQSAQRALDIRRKLFGEEHSSTADSYHSLSNTQHDLGDFSSALQSAQRPLDIRRKLFGEEHSSTADSYHSLGVTQHELGDFSSALKSKQRALEISRKLFGEEHSRTADNYLSLAITQRKQRDFFSALQSAQRALDIRRKLFGEEHSSTADSYHSLGVIQRELGDFSSALQSAQRALHIRRKLFGEEHSSTADSYHSLSNTQHDQGDFSSALQSAQRALDIRRKLFGEEHSSTADRYHSLGVTQHQLGDFSSAFKSKQRALDIRRKLFGEEHSSTADSYHSLGVTQHALGDFSPALKSKQGALEISRKLFREEHSRTADNYLSLGITQRKQRDFFSAL